MIGGEAKQGTPDGVKKIIAKVEDGETTVLDREAYELLTSDPSDKIQQNLDTTITTE